MRTPTITRLTAAAAILTLAAGHSTAAADTIDVLVHHSAFIVFSNVPGQNTPHGTVQLGDTVRWMWHSDFHSVTADAGLFDSGVHDTGFMFEHTFSELGAFPYYCSIHGAPGGIGMAGSITVVPAPSALAALAAAGLLAAGRRRRR